MKDFLIGVIFVTIGIPLLDSISVIIASVTEVIKGYCAVKVTKINSKITEINGAEEAANLIGFQAPIEEDDYDEN